MRMDYQAVRINGAPTGKDVMIIRTGVLPDGEVILGGLTVEVAPYVLKEIETCAALFERKADACDDEYKKSLYIQFHREEMYLAMRLMAAVSDAKRMLGKSIYTDE